MFIWGLGGLHTRKVLPSFPNHIFVICSSVDGYLGWSHDLVLLKSVVMCKRLCDMLA